MPQMAPYNWLMLFFMFNLIILFMLTFFNYMYLPQITTYKNKSKYLYIYIWKW